MSESDPKLKSDLPDILDIIHALAGNIALALDNSRTKSLPIDGIKSVFVKLGFSHHIYILVENSLVANAVAEKKGEMLHLITKSPLKIIDIN